MKSSKTPEDIAFQDLLDSLLDEEAHFHPRFLYRLSDLEADDLSRLEETWSGIPVWRRQALMEDLEQLFESDYLLSFESICRLALQDNDSRVRFIAVRSLMEYDTPDLLPFFLDKLENDTNVDVRAITASALGNFVFLGECEEIPPKALKKIENLLIKVAHGSDDVLVRRRALEALGFSSRAEVPSMIEEAYNIGEKDWLISALYAMGRSHNNRWNSLVLQMLDSIFPDVRFEAARAAGELEIKNALTQLLNLLDDPDVDVRASAIWSLSQIGGENVWETLEDMMGMTEDEKEIELLEAALDNLAFNQGLQLHALFDFPEEEIGENDIDSFENLEDFQD